MKDVRLVTEMLEMTTLEKIEEVIMRERARPKGLYSKSFAKG